MTERTLIRDEVEALPVFHGPPESADLRMAGFTGPIRRMNLNECPHPPSPKVVEAIREAAAQVNRYPDSKWRPFVERLSRGLEVEVPRIVCGNGSDYLLQAVADVFLRPGDAAVMPDPSFGRYAVAARSRGARIDQVPLRADGANDVGGLLGRITAETRVLLAATPNNPTGGMLQGEDLARLIEETPEEVLLVLDEAYFEFARFAGGPDGLEAIKSRRGPWIVMRTLSKAYGLAGLRLGYALCSSTRIAEALGKIRQAFQVSRLALAAGTAALADQAYAHWIQEQNAAQRARLITGLEALGLAPLPSVANFVAAAMPGPAGTVIDALAARGIMIGGVRAASPGYENFIRITIGLPDDIDAVLAVLKTCDPPHKGTTLRRRRPPTAGRKD